MQYTPMINRTTRMALWVNLAIPCLIFSTSARAEEFPTVEKLLQACEAGMPPLAGISYVDELWVRRDESWRKAGGPWEYIRSEVSSELAGRFSRRQFKHQGMWQRDPPDDAQTEHRTAAVWLSSESKLYSAIMVAPSEVRSKKMKYPGVITISSMSQAEAEKIRKPYAGMQFHGWFGQDRPIVDVLRDGNPQLEQGKLMLGGAECYVLKSKSGYGKFRVWIDPTRDHQIVRLEQHQGEGDAPNSLRSRLPLPGITGGAPIVGASSAYEVKKLERVDGRWFAVEATSEGELRFGEKDAVTRASAQLRRSKIRLLPKFEDSAFDVTFPDGLSVKESETAKNTGPHIWKGGKSVPEISPDTILQINQAMDAERAARSSVTKPTTHPAAP